MIDNWIMVKHAHHSSIGAEHVHASLACHARRHEEMEEDALVVRSTVHHMRSIFSEEKTDRQLAKSEREMNAAICKVPFRMRAPIAFFNEVEATVRAKLPLGAKLTSEQRTSIKRKASLQWKLMDPSEKKTYEGKALEGALKSNVVKSEAVIDHLSVKGLRKQRLIDEDKQTGVPCRISHCKFSEWDLSMVGRLLSSSAFSRKEVAQKRARVMQPPSQIDAENARGKFGSVKLDNPITERNKEPVFDWAYTIIQAREYFNHCALFVDTDEKSQVYLFMFAMDTPLKLALFPIEDAPFRASCLPR